MYSLEMSLQKIETLQAKDVQLGDQYLKTAAQGFDLGEVNSRIAGVKAALGEERLSLGKEHKNLGIASMIGAAFLYSELGDIPKKRYCARSAYVATKDPGLEKFIWEVFLS
jgi:hypothetical protein